MHCLHYIVLCPFLHDTPKYWMIIGEVCGSSIWPSHTYGWSQGISVFSSSCEILTAVQVSTLVTGVCNDHNLLPSHVDGLQVVVEGGYMLVHVDLQKFFYLSVLPRNQRCLYRTHLFLYPCTLKKINNIAFYH